MFSQDAVWVEISNTENQYQLVRDAPSVSFNDRTYRFEIAATNFLEDDKLIEMVVWSAEFIPDVYVREATSAAGRRGDGEIVARAEFEQGEQNGVTYYIQRLRFQPIQSADYRFVVTSVHDISDARNAYTGLFNFTTIVYQFQVPEAVAQEPTPDGLSCSVVGTDTHKWLGDPGSYGAVWYRDNQDTRYSDRTFRFMAFSRMDWQRAQSLGDSLKRLEPSMNFVDMMTQEEACRYVLNECRAVKYFANYCSGLGLQIPPER